ncbi:MAG: hypothetical protein NTV22_19040 [bacterium]|nr:hypothetical protein [bacterium]
MGEVEDKINEFYREAAGTKSLFATALFVLETAAAWANIITTNDGLVTHKWLRMHKINVLNRRYLK